MNIEIYRFGNYVNVVENKEALREWIIANVPYGSEMSNIPDTASLKMCINFAKSVGYTFKMDESFDRVDRILSVAKIEDVAKELLTLKKKGADFVFDCPFCEGNMTGYISPKHQIYKCFVCGKTGSVINLVMDVKKVSFVDAIKYLENIYKIS